MNITTNITKSDDTSKNVSKLEILSDEVIVADGVKYDASALTSNSEPVNVFPFSFHVLNDKNEAVYFKRASSAADNSAVDVTEFPHYLIWPEGESKSPQDITETIVLESVVLGD